MVFFPGCLAFYKLFGIAVIPAYSNWRVPRSEVFIKRKQKTAKLHFFYCPARF